MKANGKGDVPDIALNLVTDPIEVERLTIQLALQVERFLLGIDHSINRIVHGPYEREKYEHDIHMSNNWESLIGYASRMGKCFELAKKLPNYRIAATDGKIRFDVLVPNLTQVRNVFEHFDEYLVGNGRNKSVDPLQAISYGMSRSTFHYADLRISISEIQQATEVTRMAILTGDILSILENKKSTFTTLIQRKKYEANP